MTGEEQNLKDQSTTDTAAIAAGIARVRRIADGVVAHRDCMSYMEVARAKVVLASLGYWRNPLITAKRLGISRQTKHNWLKPMSLQRWLDYWEKRQAIRGQAPQGAIKARGQRITEEDWVWITETMIRRGLHAASWGCKTATIRDEAQRVPERAHLMGLSRVTLWRARAKLSGLAEALEHEPRTVGRPVTGGAGTQ